MHVLGGACKTCQNAIAALCLCWASALRREEGREGRGGDAYFISGDAATLLTPPWYRYFLCPYIISTLTLTVGRSPTQCGLPILPLRIHTWNTIRRATSFQKVGACTLGAKGIFTTRVIRGALRISQKVWGGALSCYPMGVAPMNTMYLQIDRVFENMKYFID